MKGNIKRLAVLLIITVIAIFMMADTVTAEWRNHRSIQGVYAATGSGSCIIAPLGFDNLVPKSGISDLLTFTEIAVFTFYSDGTGKVERTCSNIQFTGGPPGFPPPPYAWDGGDSWEFTYKVKRDGSITLTQVHDSYEGYGSSGPFAGFTYKNENRNRRGTVSPDAKTIILNGGLPDIITSPPSITEMVCNDSAVLIWQHDIRWGWKHDQDDDDDNCHD
jgi:hypothetical protein